MLCAVIAVAFFAIYKYCMQMSTHHLFSSSLQSIQKYSRLSAYLIVESSICVFAEENSHTLSTFVTRVFVQYRLYNELDRGKKK